MSKILLLILAVALSTASASITQTACQYIISEEALYSLFGFETQVVQFSSAQNITFNLCSGVPACAASDITGSVFATLNTNQSKSNTECDNIAQTITPTTSFIDSSNPDLGFTLSYPFTTDGTDQNVLVVTLTCDSTPIFQMSWDSDVITSNGTTTYTLQSSGAPGCPVVTLESYLAFFDEYRGVFAAAFIIIGLFALLVGFHFFNASIFIFTAVGVAVALFVILYGFAAIKTSIAVEWVLFVLCCIVGLGCGYGAVKLEKVGFFVLGSFLGGLSALFLYSFLLHFFQLSEVVLYVVIVVLALFGGLLSLWLWKDIIILATSCIGAYLFVRGFSFFIGGFPNELAVAEGLQTYDYAAYGYLVVIVLVAIGGMIFQFKRKKRNEKAEKDITANREDSISRERLLQDDYM